MAIEILLTLICISIVAAIYYGFKKLQENAKKYPPVDWSTPITRGDFWAAMFVIFIFISSVAPTKHSSRCHYCDRTL